MNEPLQPPHGRARLDWPVVGRLAAVYAVTRLFVGFIVLCASWLSGGQQSLYGALTKWDSGWYGYIAQSGYPDTVGGDATGARWAFYPAWPALLRAVYTVAGGSWQRNGIALAFVLGFVTVVLLYLAVGDVFGGEIAERTVLLFLVAPTACVLAMPYSEVLFVPCCIACLLALGRRRWELAGIAAAIGGATRLAGVALVLACLVAALVEHRRSRSWRPFVAPAIAPLGLVGFFVLQRVRTGHWNASFTAQRYWDNGNSFGMSVVRAVRDLATSRDAWQYPPNLLVPLAVALCAAGLVALWTCRDRVPLSWWVLSLVLGAVALAPTLSYSVPRFLLPIFPAAAGLAAKVPQRWTSLLIATSAVLMTAFGLLYFNTISFQMAP